MFSYYLEIFFLIQFLTSKVKCFLLSLLRIYGLFPLEATASQGQETFNYAARENWIHSTQKTSANIQRILNMQVYRWQASLCAYYLLLEEELGGRELAIYQKFLTCRFGEQLIIL